MLVKGFEGFLILIIIMALIGILFSVAKSIGKFILLVIIIGGIFIAGGEIAGGHTPLFTHSNRSYVMQHKQKSPTQPRHTADKKNSPTNSKTPNAKSDAEARTANNKAELNQN